MNKSNKTNRTDKVVKAPEQSDKSDKSDGSDGSDKLKFTPEVFREMFAVLAGICQEKSAHICQYRPESCKVCQINKVLKKARGEECSKSEKK